MARRPEQLVLRVDRTDPSKNIVRGFRAFALLLERHPELHGRVGMVALLAPSRQDIPEYAEYVGAVEAAAREVNERFGRDDWQPVELDVADDFLRSIAGYKQFDVLLVNPVFDGLNLVTKEAFLVNERDGALVLSENAGVHEELGEWAVTVESDRRLRPGGRAVRGAHARGRRAPPARRGDPRARAHARHHRVGRRAAGRPRRRTILLMNDLSHVDESGAVRMVDVGGKEPLRRRAVARAEVRMAAATARILRELPKGDALATAQLAGIMAAKRTSELIPLCHPLPLSHVEVTLEVGEDSVEIVSAVETTAQTGVEMEALTAASVAALTVYDMAKAVDKEMRIADVVLVEKTKERVV